MKYRTKDMVRRWLKRATWRQRWVYFTERCRIKIFLCLGRKP